MKLKLSKSHIVILLIGLAILIYITAKATVSSFTHDESFTYLHYVHTSFMDIISFKDWYPNNHILNSLFMKYSEILFGSSEISLRLPNIISLVIYMIYSFLLFRKCKPLLTISLFILLCTNNSLIDLFGLARGYGLSIGFMLMSLYHFMRSFHEQRTKHIALFHLGALLAILSSFVLLDFYVSLIIIYNVIVFIDAKFLLHEKFQFIKANKVHVIPFLINVYILYEPVRRVTMNSNLDFGGKKGFYSGPVFYLINYALHGLFLPHVEMIIMKIIFTSIVLIPFIILIKTLIKKNQGFYSENKELIISNLLLLSLSVIMILQHIVFKRDYPIARFSMFLLPLFIIGTGYFLAYLYTNYQKPVIFSALGLALISTLSFISKADLYSCSEWGYDSETKNMVVVLSDYYHKHETNDNKIKLGINWLFEPTINFYRTTKHLDWLLPVNRNGLTSHDNYDYIFDDQLKSLNSNDYRIIAKFRRTNTVLVQKTNMQ